MKRIIKMAGLALVVGMVTPVATADIYVYRDENGVVNATNVMPPDRYKVDKVFRDKKKTSATKVDPVVAKKLHADTPFVKTSLGTVNTKPLAVPPSEAKVHAIMAEAASAFKVDRALVQAIIEIESAFDVHAISVKGARGLMQLMPETAARYGVRDIFDPEQNIWGGVRYVRDLLEKFDNDLSLALAAYNAGENAVARYGGIPPYPETREYVHKVMSLQQYFQGS